MGNLTQNDMTIVLILVAVIVILLAIIAVLDIISKKKKKEEQEEVISQQIDLEEKIVEETELQDSPLPIELPVMQVEETKVFTDKPNHVQEIKYVEEDEELEKTKARIELAELKEELARQEEMKKQELEQEKEKQIVVQEEVQVEAVQEEQINEIEEVKTEENIVETEVVEEEPVVESTKINVEEIELLELDDETTQIQEFTKQEVSDIANAINIELAKLEEANLEKALEVQEDLNEILEISKEEIIAAHEDEQERKAIISVEEFNKISDEMYDSNEVIQAAYEDEGDEPISLTELENLYNTREMKAIKLEDFETIKEEEKEAIIKEKESEIKKMEDLPPIAIEKKFKSSPFISPVYGISETKETIELEQTANLDKLNEEIKKTNEFLKTLKELQKNLD